MGGVVEGMIAVMGLTAGVMVALAALLTGDVPRSTQYEEKHHHSRTIRLNDERMAA
ncbi:MAG: hypothetical protein NPIRA02_39050 [Nitrospirales bacterium]|nr:MAG: hypothetical protein NPIRA02_39050 [Nitrospirales bacterium]